jgi:hypothetical protein
MIRIKHKQTDKEILYIFSNRKSPYPNSYSTPPQSYPANPF